MTTHPGRVAMLTRAAFLPDLTDAERAHLIRLGAPHYDAAHVERQLVLAVAARKAGDARQVSTIIARLTEGEATE